MSMSNPTPLRAALVAGAFVLAAPAAAQEEGAGPAAAETKAAPESEELICRTEKVIGSRAKKRKTCLTKEQWERVATQGSAFARSLVESRRSGMCGSGADVC